MYTTVRLQVGWKSEVAATLTGLNMGILGNQAHIAYSGEGLLLRMDRSNVVLAREMFKMGIYGYIDSYPHCILLKKVLQRSIRLQPYRKRGLSSPYA